MRDLKVIPASLAALAVIGLAGCGGGGGDQTPASSAATYSPAPLTPAQMAMKAGAQAEAVTFFAGYAEGKFATTWSQLSPAVRKRVSRKVWVKVHTACRTKSSGQRRTVQAITVFGTAAIVTSTAPSGTATTEDVFNYVSGKWRFTPKDMAIYGGKSVSADIRAAKAAGVCASWKGF